MIFLIFGHQKNSQVWEKYYPNFRINRSSGSLSGIGAMSSKETLDGARSILSAESKSGPDSTEGAREVIRDGKHFVVARVVTNVVP